MEIEKTTIKYPLATEKAIRMIEAQNIITFVVERTATKKEIKKQLEEAYKVKIKKLNTCITPDGKKRAYAKLGEDTPAIDIATQLGLI
ncbi:50S ribosomal protein L23 [Candidatus Woesearchaeota archaeon CG10_big_fil_rev_8_21_14_0_10_34_8]|nr:MAG: 50S ribosomal protein L23 [Candidatus Woesearchaeota archaeon CG10_big_fil_rev_8_21_14_0_10_34_8]